MSPGKSSSSDRGLPPARAFVHPLPLVAMVAGFALLPALRGGALPIALVMYLGAVAGLMLSWARGDTRSDRRLPQELRGRARELAERALTQETEIRAMVASGGAEVEAMLQPAADEIADLAARAVALAVTYQRALDHRESADVGQIEEERDVLIRKMNDDDDTIVSRQLEEAIASVDRRLHDLDDLERSAARCEAAILNIQTTLEGLATRILKCATTERGAGSHRRQELAQEIDTVRATASALEDIIEDEEQLHA